MRANIAPWDDAPSPMTQPRHSNPNEFPLHQGSNNTPAIHRQQPSGHPAPPWASNNDENRTMPTSVFGSFYNDSNENLGQVSPGFAPPGGMGFPGDGEDRRPSIASATTVSSQGSKGSIGGKYRKKLQGFFGEEFTNPNDSSSRQNSEASSLKGVLPAFAPGGSRNRNNSMNDAMLTNGPPSPGSSRPRTPAHGPSSEVTPWVFQDTQVGSLGKMRLLHCRRDHREGVTDLSSGAEQRQPVPLHRPEQQPRTEAFNWRTQATPSRTSA